MINAFFGRSFKPHKSEAFALFHGLQALGAAIGGFIVPFFLKNTWREGFIGGSGIFFVLSCLLAFGTKTATRKRKAPTAAQEIE